MSGTVEHASSIQCQSLSLQYASGPSAVSELDLDVAAGEITALIGPSGCGKTSLLRLMAQLETPTQGTVTLDPPVVSRRGGIAFVFQQPTLLPWRTAIENVMLPLELIGRGDSGQRRQAACEVLEKVELLEASDRFPHQLSGGMKMRVSLARAVVTQPSVLLLDEPFAALDDMLRNQLGELVLDLWRQHRFTAVMVTHNIAEAILMSSQIAVMGQGHIAELIDNPMPRPRTESLRTTAEFGRFYGQVRDALRGAS